MNKGKSHVEVIQWVLDQLQKYSLYVNLKKCCFHQEQVRFFNYIISYKSIHMKKEQITAVHN